jgi:hypothetical protein|nr:MAG TPA: Structural protein [Crassvirales sp.]
MNIFSTNQANQVYVAKALKENVAALTDLGDIVVKATPDKSAIYFQHKGAGGIVRSDLIEVKNILWGKTTKAKDMARKLKVATVTLSNLFNGGNPIEGQDYILTLTFTGYVGISPENSQYWKHGVVHIAPNMTASDFYKQMALSLAKNMSREAVKLVKITLSDGTEVLPTTKVDTLTGVYTNLVITEVEQDWILGTKQQKALTFDVMIPGIDLKEGSFTASVKWGKAVISAGDSIKNGKLMADYEYFHMGERGDQYRMVNFPDYVPTKYLVDPSKEYDTIALHYSYIGSNESVQKSEKDITLIVPTGGAAALIAKINPLIAASGVVLADGTA